MRRCATTRSGVALLLLLLSAAGGARAGDPATPSPLRLLCLPSEAVRGDETDTDATEWDGAASLVVGEGDARVVVHALHGEAEAAIRTRRAARADNDAVGQQAPGLELFTLKTSPRTDRAKPFPATFRRPGGKDYVTVDLVLARKGFFESFDAIEGTAVPQGTAFARTGGGAPGEWKVVDAPDAPTPSKALAQTSTDETSYRFPMLVWGSFEAKDVRVAARFRTVSGKVDQAAGLVARYQGEDDYYVVRANALEDNVRLYRVVGGKREQFAGADLKVEPAVWHSLALEIRGLKHSVFFDGRLLFEAEDAAIPKAGRAGLWTKADSVTWFDDVEIGELYPAETAK